MDLGTELLFIPWETIQDCFANEGLVGIGYDPFFNTHSETHAVTLKYIKVQEMKSFLMQTYKGIGEDVFRKKCRQLVQASTQCYSPHYQKILGLSWRNYLQKYYDLIVLYDNNYTENSFEFFLRSSKAKKSKIEEQLLWELVKASLDSALVFGLLHCQYMCVSPLNISCTKNVEQKFLFGNLGLYVPGGENSDQDIFHAVALKETPAFDSASSEDIVKAKFESALVFKVALLILYSIDSERDSLPAFSKHVNALLEEPKSLQNFAKQLIKQGGYSHQLLSLVYECLASIPEARPSLQKLIKDDIEVYFVREEMYFEGVTGRNSFKYKGFVKKMDKKSSNPNSKEKEKDIYLPQGLGIIDNVLIGEFQDMKPHGFSLSFNEKEMVWGRSFENKDGSILGALHRKGLFCFVGWIEKKTNQILKGLMLSASNEARDASFEETIDRWYKSVEKFEKIQRPQCKVYIISSD